MSRSPYDPPPQYTWCEHCGGQYDNSGYYGPDPHMCMKKARCRILAVVDWIGEPAVRRILDEIKKERET